MAQRLGVAVAALGLLLGMCSGVWFHGRDAGRAEVRRDWEAANRVVAAEIIRRDREYRALEDKHRKAVKDVTDAYHEQAKTNALEVDGVLADLRGDNLRLRDRLRGCSAAPRPDSDPAAGPATDGAAPTGLSRSDEEFLIRLSAEADATALRLQHLQDYVRGLPAYCGG